MSRKTPHPKKGEWNVLTQRTVSTRRKLTERQVDILVQLSNGDAYKSIASRMRLSQAAIAYHVGNMQRLLGAPSLPALVALAIVAGVLTSDQWPIEATGDYFIDHD
jgi:DNA-binding NarL/FixJ family response regulator